MAKYLDYDGLKYYHEKITDIIEANNSDTEHIDITQAKYNALSKEEKEDPSKYYFIIDGAGGGGSIEIVDNLTSTDGDKALSANQGKVLNDKIEAVKYTAGDGIDITDNVISVDDTIALKSDILTDTWTSVVTKNSGSDTSVAFDNLNSTYGYDLYAETTDGSLVNIVSCAKSTGTNSGTIKLTYTVKEMTSAQVPVKFKLRVLK